jgi:alcohol dehydrogenase class IV
MPIHIEFGRHVSRRASAIADRNGWSKGLIVTDKGVSKARLIDGIIDSLNSVNIRYEVFDEVQPNPINTTVEKGAELLRKDGSIDFIIAVGEAVPYTPLRESPSWPLTQGSYETMKSILLKTSTRQG